MEINIETAVRICPINCRSSNGNGISCLQPNTNNNTIELANSQSFPVNHALPVHTTQASLYNAVITPLLNFLIEGCDVSVVAFGQSETGKTYSLFGPGFHIAASEAEHGIVPRFIRELFTKIKQYRDRTYTIHITWSQICGESVQDLLGAGSVECTDILDAFQLIQLGMSNTAPKCAHTLFTLTLDQEWMIDATVQHRVSTASFTDLAGSDKVFVYDNNGLVQSLPTDSGLLSLHQCIMALSEPYFSNYGNNIPYGQSVLSTLLKDSFGGRAKTILLCTVSPLVEDFAESLYTLQLALRSQTIKNFVTVNSYTTFQNIQENYDIFGLQFAANQLLKLVSNAEELFQKLLTNSSLSKGELEQISRWLTFKQECEECLSENSEPHRSLDIIEEEDAEDNTSCNSVNSSDSEDVDEEQEQEQNAQNNMGKFETLMKDFSILTDEIVSRNHQEDYSNNSVKEHNSNSSNEYHKKGARGRRGSIHSAEELRKSFSVDSKICEEPSLDSEDKICEDDGLTYEMKKKLLKKIISAIQGYQKQITDLQKTIQVKEKLMQQLVKNKNIKNNARVKLEQKCQKLIKEYEKVMAACTQAEINKDCDLERKCQLKLSELKKKINDAESLKVLTEESNRKLSEVENSVQTSKKQLEKLKKCKRKEEKRKTLYEAQLKEERKKTGTSQDSLEKQKSSSETKNSNENKQLVVLTRPNLLNLSLENAESLRHEIRNLRKTRDYLLEQRYKINTKSIQKKILNESEERKLLQYEEAIEAIDLAMEYKNEILCGRIPVIAKSLDYIEEEGDQMLMDRLMKLNETEMRILLYNYFEKIVDLRNSSKKLELQVVDIENQNENLCCRVQNLSHTLQQVRLESERRIIALQHQHENKLQLVMRHLASDSGDNDRVVSRVSKHALAFQMAGTSKQGDKSLIARFTRYARQETVPKQLQATVSVPQAIVTRQKNKLFIQQTQK